MIASNHHCTHTLLQIGSSMIIPHYQIPCKIVNKCFGLLCPNRFFGVPSCSIGFPYPDSSIRQLLRATRWWRCQHPVATPRHPFLPARQAPEAWTTRIRRWRRSTLTDLDVHEAMRTVRDAVIATNILNPKISNGDILRKKLTI